VRLSFYAGLISLPTHYAPNDSVLTITMVETNPGIDPSYANAGTIWFDYFLTDDQDVPPSVSDSAGHPDTPANLKAGSPSQGSKPMTLSTGAIIAIVISGLFLLLGALYLLFMWRRMRAKSRLDGSYEKRKCTSVMVILQIKVVSQRLN
jgi:hypothetical protein